MRLSVLHIGGPHMHPAFLLNRLAVTRFGILLLALFLGISWLPAISTPVQGQATGPSFVPCTPTATPQGCWQEATGDVVNPPDQPLGGRVTSLAVPANMPGVVFAGTAGGGVWRRMPAQSMQPWQQINPDDPTLSVGALALDPLNPNTLYAGTGNNWLGFGSLPGEGIRYTHDALDPNGPHWNWLIDPATGQPALAGHHIFSLLIDAAAPRSGPFPSNVLAATDDGIFQSGDGGQTWTQHRANQIAWVVAQPPDYATGNRGQVMYAAVSDRGSTSCHGLVLISTNSGASWRAVRGFSSAGNNAGVPMRIGLGVGRGDALFAAASDCSGALLNNGNGGGLFASFDRGKNWAVAAAPADWFKPNQGIPAGQGNYDNVVAVDPVDSRLVVLGGVFVFTLDTGSPGSQNSGWNFDATGSMHNDFHAVTFSPDGNVVYFATDGGVYATPVQQAPPQMTVGSAANLNAGLHALQFYRGDATDANHIQGGAQDNGNIGNASGGWQTYTPDSDGSAVSIIDQSVYWEEDSTLVSHGWSPAGPDAHKVTLCGDSPSCWNSKPGRVIDTPSGLVSVNSVKSALLATNHLIGLPLGGNNATAPLAYSPSLGGASLLSDCQLMSNALFFPFTHEDCFTALAAHVSADNGGVALGSDLGQVWVHSGGFNNGSGWHFFSPGNNHKCSSSCVHLPAPTQDSKIDQVPWITGAAITFSDPPEEVWVTLGSSTAPRVWHTTNALENRPGGPAWSSVDTPGIAGGQITTGIAVDPGHPSVLYLSTSKGVYECTQCNGPTPQPNWLPPGGGLPNVWVSSVSVMQDRSHLIAWTFGRGVWIMPTPVPSLQPSAHGFGTVTPGSASTPSGFTFENHSPAPVAISSVSITGSNSADFSAISDGCSGQTVQPGQSCTLQVQFHPATSGPKSAILVVQYAWGSTTDHEQAQLSGAGSSCTDVRTCRFQ